MNLLTKLHNENLGKLILRITIAGLMLFHGVSKIKTGVDWMIPMLQAKGAPEIMRYGAFVGEIVAPVFILLGFWTRTAALVLAGNMAVAVWLAHSNDFAKLNEMSGAWALELQAWYFFAALAIFFLGAGKYSVDGWLLRREVAAAPPPVAPPVR